MEQIHIDKLIECGSELEACDYNTQFYSYDGSGFSIDVDRKIKRNARARAKRIIAQYGWDIIERTAETNEALDYALQFIY